jgi:hypothetical protein
VHLAVGQLEQVNGAVTVRQRLRSARAYSGATVVLLTIRAEAAGDPAKSGFSSRPAPMRIG